MTAIACETILSCLKELPGEPRTRIGILTYDSQVHFYQLSGEITQPKMYVMSNVDDPYIPLPPDEFVVNISDSEELITELLEQYQRISFFAQKKRDVTFLSVIRCLFHNSCGWNAV